MALPLFGSIAACSAGPDYARPAAPSTGGYVAGEAPARTASVARPGGEAQAFVQGSALPPGWWQWFGSPELNRLVERAFAGSPTLAAARARLRGAEATLAARRALRSPEVALAGAGSYGSQQGGGQGGGQTGGGSGQQPGGGDPGAPTDPGAPPDPDNPTDPNNPGAPGGGQGNQGNQGGQGFSLGGRSYAVYTATATVRYDLDIAGRNRRLIESAAASVENQRQELQAAYLALVGNIVSTAFEGAALAAQIEARETLIEGQNRRIALIRTQVEEGAVARVGLVTALAEVAALRATLPPLRAQLAAAENGLAELIGLPPERAGVPRIALAGLRLPRTLPIALPSVLVRTRPDILASEALLRVASAEVGVAEAALYPNLVLDASFGVGGVDSAIDSFFGLGGNLLAPLFDGGRRRAQRDVAVAAYEEALANYRARVLAAFVQVANGIRALENDAAALAEQSTALEAARESLDLAVFQAEEGAVSNIDVLVVQQRYQDAVFAYVDALARRFQDTASLFAALGPGPLDAQALASVTVPEHLAATRAALDAGTPPAGLPTP